MNALDPAAEEMLCSGMTAKPIAIESLQADSPFLALCARWRYEAFLLDEGLTFEASLKQLEELIVRPGGEAVLMASFDGVPAGSCLLVREELEPRHDLTPWLAALYVAPQFRGRGIGRALVAAIEERARSAGWTRLHLYTVTAETFYARLGWQDIERFDWDGDPFVLMQRDL